MNTNHWKEKNIFVTGATGFLGSWLTKELIEMGACVVTIERDYEPHSNFYRFGLDKKVRIAKGDIVNFFLAEIIFNEYEVELCFHLAAQPLVPTANRLPLSTFESNVRGTWNILEAARRSALKPKVVVASSDKAYGNSPDLPYRETHPLRGGHPYDVSKTCVDLLAQSYFATYNLPVAIVRCGNFYGGGDINWSRIVPGTMRAIIYNQNPVIRSDGKLLRDYFFIKDVVGAYLLVGEKMDDEKIYGEAFNFGLETPVGVLDLVQKMIDLSGKTYLNPQTMGINHGEIPAQFLCAEKARTVLGWKSNYTLEQGLILTYEWYKDFFKR